MSEWIYQVFEADAVQRGGIVRRSVSDVEKYASRGELVQAVRQRGYHLLETGDQFVIICNSGEFKIYC